MDSVEFTADSEAKRVDAFLSAFLGLSRSYAAILISEGHILMNGKSPRKSDGVKAGDSFKVVFPKEKIPDITPKEIPFDIIFDTARYAVINKPAGIAVHPAPGHYDDSLVNGLLHAFNINDEEGAFRPGIVHRLDKDTSGLLVVAKDRQARETLSRLFRDRQMNKYYMAVASGIPRFVHTVVDTPIGRDRKNRQRMAVCEDGRPARTGITVKEQYKNAFLAEISLYSGRTHQIRVHLKHIGHPLLGDSVYGGTRETAFFVRQALHAHKLEFTDPFSDKEISVRAKLPEDMAELLAKLRTQG
ncbi:MAG: RluA family pseudouridine synthase [Deferribacteraceae bacterium]|jgi:23S rRNA pseudouridine1911/1915/1917 synthase|nr:RluA family pseudouridine synthase [Deferribacteraceae bacterium]